MRSLTSHELFRLSSRTLQASTASSCKSDTGTGARVVSSHIPPLESEVPTLNPKPYEVPLSSMKHYEIMSKLNLKSPHDCTRTR